MGEYLICCAYFNVLDNPLPSTPPAPAQAEARARRYPIWMGTYYDRNHRKMPSENVNSRDINLRSG